MILVVADTGPLCYLVLIEAVALLPRLFDRVIIPRAVYAELSHVHAPVGVQEWASTLPPWAEVKHASRIELSGILDPGEAEAIALAQELSADSLLLDETEARQEALRLGLPVSGTLGILEKAAEHNWINLPQAFQRLSRTNFHIARDLLQQALQRDAARHRRSE